MKRLGTYIKRTLRENIVISTFVHIRALLGRKYKKLGILMIILVPFTSVLEVVGLAAVIPFLKVTVDPESVQNNEYFASVYDYFGFTSHEQFVIFMAVGLLIVFVVKNTMILTIKYYQTRYAFGVATYLSKKQFSKIFRRDYYYFKNTNSKEVLRDIANMPQRFATKILLGYIRLISELLILLFIVIGICIYRPLLFLGVVTLLGTGFFIIYYSIKNKVYRLGVEMKNYGPLAKRNVHEPVLGYIDVRVSGTLRYFRQKFIYWQRKLFNTMVWQQFFNQMPSKLNEVVAVLGIVLIFLYGVIAVEATKDIIVFLAVFAVATYRIIPSVNRILKAMMGIKNGWVSLEILSEDLELRSTQKTVRSLEFEQRIVFEDVSFKFRDGTVNLFEELNFEAGKGQRVGIIGKTGTGKSTILKLLLGLHYPDSGSIKIDDIPLTKENIEQWRDKVGYVQQDIFLIDATLKENIAFGVDIESIDEQKLHNVIELAGLKPFVDELPRGVETPVGELGAKVSGGQKQRLCIARALYHEAEVFLFDEATSSLDPKTEESILNSIDKLSDKKKTILIVSHRISTLRDCDKILELKGGRIIDTHQYQQLKKRVS